MLQTFAQITRTTPGYGVQTGPTGTAIISRGSVPEGFRAWLPALVILVGMPLLALATTKYVVLPSVKQALAPTTSLSTSPASTKFLAKIPINISGSGIRSIAVLGGDNAFKDIIAKNKGRLAGLAASMAQRPPIFTNPACPNPCAPKFSPILTKRSADRSSKNFISRCGPINNSHANS
jgi:hypothetical protein